MHLLLNALSSTNLSGRQVACGHLIEMLCRTDGYNRFTLLVHDGNYDIYESVSSQVGREHRSRLFVHVAPSRTCHWLARSLYESVVLPSLIRKLGVDAYLSMSGTWTRRLPCRQYTLALNPLPIVQTGPVKLGSWVKSLLQKHAYRLAVLHADGIGYGSGYMRDIYRRNAGRNEKCGAIVYPALSTTEIEAMELVKSEVHDRDTRSILCVSLMARHKSIETLIRALKHLRDDYQVPARLRLVGGWPDQRYRKEIESIVADLELASCVEFTGHLTREELRIAYRRAHVFCLLSKSESFGIPAVEAQRMGTPTVGANCCAVPEVCGDGGWYAPPGSPEDAARLLHKLLTDEQAWSTMSKAAEVNATRFEYRRTVEPLLDMMEIGYKRSA